MNTPELMVRSTEERLSKLREEARARRAVRPRVLWRFEVPGIVFTVSLRAVRQTA